MKIAFPVVAAMNIVFIACAPAAEKPTAEQLLAEYQKSVEKPSRFRLETVEHQWKTGSSDERIKDNPAKDNKDGYVGATERKICHDDSCWRFSTVATNVFTRRGVRTEHKSGIEYLVGDYLNRRQALHAQWYTSKEDLTEIAKLDVWLDDDVKESRRFLGTSAIVFGQTSTDEPPLWDVMRDAKELELSSEMELVGGKPTYVVKSRGRFGQHTLWLDPQAGSLPRRIEIHKAHGDLFGNQTLGTEIAARFPKRILDEVHQSWYGIQIEEKNGISVITAFNSVSRRSRRIDDKEEKEQQRIEYRTTAVDFDPATWPADAFLPGVAIPNGTKVATRDLKASIVWIDGRVEKEKRE